MKRMTALAIEQQPETETKPQAVPVRKGWQTSAGPRQSKLVEEAISNLRREGQTHGERSGVIGVDVTEMAFWSPYSPPRKEAAVVLESLGEQFAWQITVENHKQVIARAQELLVELRKSRPVEDKTETAEKRKERDDAYRAQSRRQEEERNKRLQIVNAKIIEISPQYPWAVSREAARSDHAWAGLNVKAALASKFPTCGFSVRTDYNSVRIEWSLGPTIMQVEEATAPFKRTVSNVRPDDIIEYDNSTELEARKMLIGQFTYITTYRTFPQDTVIELGKLICAHLGKPWGGQDLKGLDTTEPHSTLGDYCQRTLRRTAWPIGGRMVGLVTPPDDGVKRDWPGLDIEFKIEAPAVVQSVSENGRRVVFNAQHHGIELHFAGRPDHLVLSKVKAARYRWFFKGKFWYTGYTAQKWEQAHEIMGIALAPAPAQSPEPDRFDMEREDSMAEQCGLTSEPRG